MVGMKVLAHAREYARRFTTVLFNLRIFTGQTVHIGCWTTQVRDNTREARCGITDFFYFTQNRFFRTVLNNTTFMFCNRTESTATETATHDVHREFDHVKRRETCITVRWMW